MLRVLECTGLDRAYMGRLDMMHYFCFRSMLAHQATLPFHRNKRGTVGWEAKGKHTGIGMGGLTDTGYTRLCHKGQKRRARDSLSNDHKGCNKFRDQCNGAHFGLSHPRLLPSSNPIPYVHMVVVQTKK